MPRMFFMYYLLIFVFIFLDQLVKHIVRANMYIGESYPLLGDFFSFTYIENMGAAFGMFEGKRIFLILIPIIAIVVGVLILRKLYKDKGKYVNVLMLGIAMLIGGGIGNLIDRIRFASVTDYFDLKNFAIFNIADIFVCVGCFLICVYLIFLENKKESIN